MGIFGFGKRAAGPGPAEARDEHEKKVEEERGSIDKKERNELLEALDQGIQEGDEEKQAPETSETEAVEEESKEL